MLSMRHRKRCPTRCCSMQRIFHFKYFVYVPKQLAHPLRKQSEFKTIRKGKFCSPSRHWHPFYGFCTFTLQTWVSLQRNITTELNQSLYYKGARGSIVVEALCCKPEGRGFDSRWGEFVYFAYFFKPHYALGITQPVTEMSTWSSKIMFLGSRARPPREADNLTAICEPIV
jgi:hypothetical protein